MPKRTKTYEIKGAGKGVYRLLLVGSPDHYVSIHVDPEFSSRTRFGRTVSHGMLLYTVLWGLVQAHYPGARQSGQTLMFPNPAYADEPLRFEIAEISAAGDRRELAVKASRVADGAVALDGQAIISIA